MSDDNEILNMIRPYEMSERDMEQYMKLARPTVPHDYKIPKPKILYGVVMKTAWETLPSVAAMNEFDEIVKRVHERARKNPELLTDRDVEVIEAVDGQPAARDARERREAAQHVIREWRTVQKDERERKARQRAGAALRKRAEATGAPKPIASAGRLRSSIAS